MRSITRRKPLAVSSSKRLAFDWPTGDKAYLAAFLNASGKGVNAPEMAQPRSRACACTAANRVSVSG